MIFFILLLKLLLYGPFFKYAVSTLDEPAFYLILGMGTVLILGLVFLE